MTMFGIAALTAPVVGPTLGGYLSDYQNWRWIFYINIPIGGLALLISYFVVKDPDYLQQERARLRRMPLNFDYIGLALLALVMCAWEVLITKGQEWDWLGDPFGKVQTLLLTFLVGGVGLVVWEMRRENPVVNFRPLGERNFWVSSLIIFCAYAVLYGASTSLPGLLQSLFGYNAYRSGLVMSPSGLASVSMLLICGTLLGRGADARWLIGGGMLVVAAGGYWMSVMNLEISPLQAILPRVVLIAGLGMAFAPINVAAFLYTPRHMRAAAVGLFALLRNEGGSFGTSMARTIQERRDQFHTLRVREFLDPFNHTVSSYLEGAQTYYFQKTGDAPLAQRMALQSLADLSSRQAASLAYFDVFFVCAMLAVALAFLVLLMKRSVAEKGAHIGAE
jgi:DHA2 family multidrug resistance protein